MKNKKQNFFYFPTWTLFFTCILFLAATIFDLYIVFNCVSFETITINGIEYASGSDGYASGLNSMRISFGVSALITFLISFVTGWLGYKRIKDRYR